MAMRTMILNGTIIIFPEGSIDSSNAGEWEEEIRQIMRQHPECEPVLDFSDLRRISSAGLRVLARITRELGKPMVVQNVSPGIYEVLDVTGFTSILDVRRQIREISVDGCEYVGRGALGTVYRIDRDTIVKVYNAPNAIEMIRNEQKRAKKAFLLGIPTAISYDVVRVGDQYGAVFEMLKAKNFNELITAHPERSDELIRRYGGIVHEVHSIETKPGDLPDAREMYIGFLDQVKHVMPDGMADRLRELLWAVPEDLHVVHGDFHMKNVMLSDDEPMLIDMETLCVGNPVFDYAGLFVAYEAFNEDDSENSMNFMGISEQLSLAIWRGCLYIDKDLTDPEVIDPIIDRIKTVGYLRFLYLVLILRNGGEELIETRIRHSLEHLEELLGRVDSLAI